MATRRAERAARRLKETAIHEAGHAVAAIFLCHKLRDVSVVPSRSYDGRTRSRWRTRFGEARIGYLEDHHVGAIQRHIMVCLAGREAARRVVRRPRGCESDLDSVLALLDRLQTDETEANLLWRLLEHRTRKLIACRWVSVERLADALLDRETLSGDEARAVALDVDLEEMRREREQFAAASASLRRKRVSAKHEAPAAAQ